MLSTAEVAELLGIPRSTVHYLARRGELPARRVGRRWLFLRDRVAAAVTPLDDPGAWRPPPTGAVGKPAQRQRETADNAEITAANANGLLF